MIQRIVASRKRLNLERRMLSSQMALWKFTRRDPGFAARCAPAVEQLALRLQKQETGARLRVDHAEEMKLLDLTAADRWWKRQWRQKEVASGEQAISEE